MFWNKKENVNNVKENEKTEQTNSKEKEIKIGSFGAIKNIVKTVFRKRDYKIEPRNITKEDKKAAILTVIIVIAIGLILWLIPFTRNFVEDIIFFRV